MVDVTHQSDLNERPDMFTSTNLFLHQVLLDERLEKAAMARLGRDARRAARADRRKVRD
jgi:hypothetical protein